jgi:hypothetical protein
MDVTRGWAGAALAAVAIGCGDARTLQPSDVQMDAATPATMTPPPVPYRFDVTASPSCPTMGFDALIHEMWFDMGMQRQGDAWVLTLAGSTPDGGRPAPSSGSLVLTFTADGADGVTGTATGAGITGDGADDVGFFAQGSAFVGGSNVGSAQLMGQGMFGAGPLSGTLSGNISYGVPYLSEGGECTAPDHTWTLTPE